MKLYTPTFPDVCGRQPEMAPTNPILLIFMLLDNPLTLSVGWTFWINSKEEIWQKRGHFHNWVIKTCAPILGAYLTLSQLAHTGGSWLLCQAAILRRRGSCVEGWALPTTMWVSLEANIPITPPIKLSGETIASANILTIREKLWTRDTQVSCTCILDPQKLWDNKYL